MSAGARKMQDALTQALEDLHARLAEAILAVDAGALHWQPAPGMQTVEQLVREVVAEERRWIAETVASLPLSDDVARGYTPTDGSRDHLLFELGSVGQVSQVVLATLPASAWVGERGACDESMTVAGCVLRTLEQLAQTLGRVEVTLQMWKAQVGS